MPAISVIMPVRNGEDFIDLAVESILRQSDPDFELLIINDHSTDSTPELVGRWVAADNRVRRLDNKIPGIVGALNTGLASARGNLVARMDSDDIALPERLAQQRSHMTSHPDLAVLGSFAHMIDREGNRLQRIEMPVTNKEISAKLFRYCPLIHPSTIIRKATLNKVNGYRQCCSLAEDYDLWLRIAEIGKLANLPEELILLRKHDGQVSRKRRLRQRAAAALARRLAYIRRRGSDEPSASDAAIDDAILAFLANMKPADMQEHGFERDTEVMIRYLWKDGIIGFSDIFQYHQIFKRIGLRNTGKLLAKMVARQ